MRRKPSATRLVVTMNEGRCIGKMFASCRSICEFHFAAPTSNYLLTPGHCVGLRCRIATPPITERPPHCAWARLLIPHAAAGFAIVHRLLQGSDSRRGRKE